MNANDAATLRARLVALRASALHQLAAAEVLDVGLMRVVADSSAVLAALEAEDSRTPIGGNDAGAFQR